MSKSYGPCVGAQQAVAFLEQLKKQMPDAGIGGDPEFWTTYDRVLNRVRYMADMSEPIAPSVQKAKVRAYGDFYSCGNCGFGLRPDTNKHCPNCGREIRWSAVHPWMQP